MENSQHPRRDQHTWSWQPLEPGQWRSWAGREREEGEVGAGAKDQEKGGEPGLLGRCTHAPFRHESLSSPQLSLSMSLPLTLCPCLPSAVHLLLKSRTTAPFSSLGVIGTQRHLSSNGSRKPLQEVKTAEDSELHAELHGALLSLSGSRVSK